MRIQNTRLNIISPGRIRPNKEGPIARKSPPATLKLSHLFVGKRQLIHERILRIRKQPQRKTSSNSRTSKNSRANSTIRDTKSINMNESTSTKISICRAISPQYRFKQPLGQLLKLNNIKSEQRKRRTDGK